MGLLRPRQERHPAPRFTRAFNALRRRALTPSARLDTVGEDSTSMGAREDAAEQGAACVRMPTGRRRRRPAARAELARHIRAALRARHHNSWSLVTLACPSPCPNTSLSNFVRAEQNEKNKKISERRPRGAKRRAQWGKLVFELRGVCRAHAPLARAVASHTRHQPPRCELPSSSCWRALFSRRRAGARP